MFGPACVMSTSTLTVCADRARCARRCTSPSRRITTSARSPLRALVAHAGRSIVCVWPTMPKRGAATSAMRRSCSSGCAGDQRMERAVEAERGGVGGMSCTWPSVIRMAPATRSGGTSASADEARRTAACRRSRRRPGRPRRRATSRPLMLLQPSTSACARLPRSARCGRRNSGSGFCRRRRRRPTAAARAPRW